ncbi:MAG: hypothetical protein IKG47_03125 [Oscillospiraceae bacterium]|nr:hypothetical protein [Oscillospiraceae bacterium]
MKKTTLLNSLKNIISNKPKDRLTDDIKQALDKYIQRHLVLPEESVADNEPALDSFPDERIDSIPEENIYGSNHSIPRPSLHYDKRVSKESFPKQEISLNKAPVSYAAGNFLPQASLDEHLRKLDDSFSESLLKLIDAKGMTDAECYKRAGIDRRHFSKMRNSNYHPKKSTVLALCVALSLSKSESLALLEKAGYTLSNSSIHDLIVEFYIVNKKWDIDLINETLYKYDQPLLGF